MAPAVGALGSPSTAGLCVARMRCNQLAVSLASSRCRQTPGLACWPCRALRLLRVSASLLVGPFTARWSRWSQLARPARPRWSKGQVRRADAPGSSAASLRLHVDGPQRTPYVNGRPRAARRFQPPLPPRFGRELRTTLGARASRRGIHGRGRRPLAARQSRLRTPRHDSWGAFVTGSRAAHGPGWSAVRLSARCALEL